jgi:L-ascorbate metabolism protein UlaG (beta-lactamase superfamily)
MQQTVSDFTPDPVRARAARLPLLARLLGWSVFAVKGVLVLVLIMAPLLWFSTDHLRAFGGRPDPAHLATRAVAAHFTGGRFENLEPTNLMPARSYPRALARLLFGKEMRTPICPLPFVADTAARLSSAAPSGLRVTWLGHSTTLIEIDGATVLTDPMWSERASPSRWAGPRRFHPPPLALAALPRVDAVLISHEHYDHLDQATVQSLAARGLHFHVPLGIGVHLAAWGVPAEQIQEHDWWEEATLPGGVRIVSTPARHFNGRGVPWRTGALWTSWSIVGPRHRAFFSGDTGPTEAMREISAREGPFDVALIEIGQYHESWGDIHLGPLGALDALEKLGARTLIPIHWSTFVLAYHAWSEPAEALVQEAERRGVTVSTPRLGEPVEPAASPPTATTAWWRALPPTAAGCP